MAQLHDLVPIFARASVGDFPKTVPIPPTEDEFTPVYVGVQIMLDVIHEKIDRLEAINAQLEKRLEKERANEKLKDDFLAFAAHQLRNPLVNIRWTTESLLEELQTDVPETLRSRLVRIYENNQRLITLTNDILSSARIQAGQWQEKKTPEHVVDVIQHCILELSVEAKSKDMTFALTLDPPDLQKTTLLFDPHLFEQVIQNIFANAIKYGNPHTTIAVLAQWDGKNLALHVTDKGMGIPTADQPHIFERFYRGSNVLATPISGSGLGLYVVKELVEHWHGTISFESTENQGTTMHISLPFEGGSP